ncbi:phosphotransferase [Bauldia sp.]|uniref:phosphotransferase n=1 Tax=Bauldia sp. TaxID=2575872 RepID=UPI003BA98772
MSDEEIELEGGGRSTVSRRGSVVFRQSGPWSSTVLALLRHLESCGIAEVPRVVGSGFDTEGRETLTYVEGDFVHPRPWGEDAFAKIGRLLRRLHDASESFDPPQDAYWQPWFGRDLGSYKRVIGHCDFAPWNIVTRDGLPVALIDWETAGPVDALVELGQVCWLNAQLHDGDVGRRVGLAAPEQRARHVALICTGYGLARRLAPELVQSMIDVAIADAAEQAISGDVREDTTATTELWGLAWRTRAAAWMMRHRALLTATLDDTLPDA